MTANILGERKTRWIATVTRQPVIWAWVKSHHDSGRWARVTTIDHRHAWYERRAGIWDEDAPQDRHSGNCSPSSMCHLLFVPPEPHAYAHARVEALRAGRILYGVAWELSPHTPVPAVQPASSRPHQHYTYRTGAGYLSPFCWPTQEAALAAALETVKTADVTIVPASPGSVPNGSDVFGCPTGPTDECSPSVQALDSVNDALWARSLARSLGVPTELTSTRTDNHWSLWQQLIIVDDPPPDVPVSAQARERAKQWWAEHRLDSQTQWRRLYAQTPTEKG